MSENARSTFARMTKQIFGNQIGRNILAYVDDIVVMSKRKEHHIADLKETVINLSSSGLKLNPEKCVFVVKEGKRLGYMISSEGISANPDKTKAIINMAEPSTRKEV